MLAATVSARRGVAVSFWTRVGGAAAATLAAAVACWLGSRAVGVSQGTAVAVALAVAAAVVALGSVWASRAASDALPPLPYGVVPGQPSAPRVAGSRVVLGEIPREPPAFQKRPELLNAIIAGPRTARVFTLTGLRGAGKSQLAAAYARRRIDENWAVVAWIDASGREQLLGAYTQLASALGLTGDTPDSAEAARRVRHWLEAHGQKCLVVLDNADSPDILGPFLPAAGAAQVLVTSARTTLSTLGVPVPVGAFTDSQAVQFLADRTGLEDPAGALRVAGELGCLPLALAQAAAVISGQRLDYSTYIQRLATVTIAGYLTRPEEDPYPRGTAEAITLALDAARQTDPARLGRNLLDVIALLSPAGVPRPMLYAAARGTVTRRRVIPRRRHRHVSEEAVDAALQHLTAWSLMTWSIDRTTIVAHRLVMRVAREDAARRKSLTPAAQRAIYALHSLLPPADQAWRYPARLQEFVQQVTALSEHLGAFPCVLIGETETNLLWLRGWAGWYLIQVSDISRGIPLLERVLAEQEKLFSPDHRNTLAGQNNLAGAYLAAGRLDEAITLYEQLLENASRVLGPDHREPLNTRNNLAAAYLAADRIDEAIAFDEQTLADRQRIIGPDDPDTLTSRNNLATAYLKAGRIDEAIALDEQTLADRQRILGSDHPDALASRNNLARSFESAGRLDEAVDLYEQTLSDTERVLGSDHSSTLISRNNLAAAYQRAGRLDKAISLFEQTLADRQRTLSSDHPDILTSRNNLATAYLANRQQGRAIALLKRTLADSERILGTKHPLTQTVRKNLASATRRRS
jgi:tetratricopeptide (TPR) repeat protein